MDLKSVLSAAQEIASELGHTFQSRIEARPPAMSLVIEGPRSDMARVIVSTIEPGTLFVDIGVGLHGEWLLRSDADIKRAIEDLEQIFEGVFSGQVVEDVRRRGFGSLTIRGTIRSKSRTFEFTHRAADSSHEITGMRQYVPYPTAL